MRGGEIIWVGDPEAPKLTIVVGYWKFLTLEGGPGGQDRTITSGLDGRPEMYYEGVLHAGDKVRIVLDSWYQANPEDVSEMLSKSVKALPTYDLAGVVEGVIWDDKIPYKIKSIWFSLIEKVAKV